MSGVGVGYAESDSARLAFLAERVVPAALRAAGFLRLAAGLRFAAVLRLAGAFLAVAFLAGGTREAS